MQVAIDAMELLQWGAKIKATGFKFRPAVARALNEVGTKVLERMVENVSAQSGLAASTVRRRFTVERASADSLMYQITASQELMAGKSSRPMQGREFERRPEGFFKEGELVNVVTMEDDRVCPLCEAIAEGNPYTIEEARAQIPHHPNCRCTVELVRGEQERPSTFRSRSEPLVQTEALTMEELLEVIQRETRILLSAI